MENVFVILAFRIASISNGAGRNNGHISDDFFLRKKLGREKVRKSVWKKTRGAKRLKIHAVCG